MDSTQRMRSEATNSNPATKIDSGLMCLVTAARLLGVPADYQQLKRAFLVADAPADAVTLLRAAKELRLKAKQTRTVITKLPKLALPSIALLGNGQFVVIVKADEKRLLIYDPYKERPLTLGHEDFGAVWDGTVILLARRFSIASLESEFNLSWFIPVIIRFKRFFGEVLIISFFLQSFGLITPLFSQVIIDKVLIHKGVTTLDILAVGLLCVNSFESLLGVLRSYLFSHTTNRVDVLLGAKLFNHLLALPLKYFEIRRVGDTVARVRELENIRQFLTGSTLTVVLDLCFATVFIAVMFFYSVKLSLVTLASIPLFVGLSLLVTPIFKRRLNHRFACGSEVQSYLVESITGIHTVKSLAIEPQLNHKWEGILANYVKASFQTTILGNMASNTAQYIQKISSLAILWFGARMVMDGTLTVGQLIAFQMLAGRVTDPVLRLANTWQDFQQIRLSIERLGDILNCPREPAFNPNRTLLPPVKGHVVLENLAFRYRDDGPLVLEGLNLDVKPGTTVGIVGRSGSGKSTLTKLIQRLYIPERGRVIIDGIDLAQVEPAWLRRQIGVVLQENYLFNGNVRENIAAVDPGAPMEKIIQAAKLAGAHEFILELPEGYDTGVGERGTALSGGQRQRIAIARTLLINPRILIFDEATSALDYQSERIIQENLEQICKGRTVFIIAHRLSTVRKADTIVVVEKGRIIEQGSHEQLIKQQGAYYSLYMQQEGSNACA
ncbi:MAG TPA: type I secretion system permease/ATPase [Methylomusa anaerophila]|uniref:Toxin RTX-I translocation ATP-binding protein n=1 Tax=Methylomusa anaerophila TaxID=1930071 RepID=A0A348AIA4_9FIRM|nr:type I secretion system permease/ATPase [Methylomusa anaerophila]BBB90802.1 toxin RTX-I translocation ATP-binding protein [Methylomusa anaerophila]HML90541.1 type I secretion system permease/ATPase [Methylomusa anaerophila]